MFTFMAQGTKIPQVRGGQNHNNILLKAKMFGNAWVKDHWVKDLQLRLCY